MKIPASVVAYGLGFLAVGISAVSVYKGIRADAVNDERARIDRATIERLTKQNAEGISLLAGLSMEHAADEAAYEKALADIALIPDNDRLCLDAAALCRLRGGC